MEQQTTPQSANRMALGNVVKGKIAKPIRVLLYGVEGVGKSVFASNAPSPIFLGAEDGTSELDVARFPEPSHWRDAFSAVRALEDDLTHPYKTLVIDTLDWLQPLCWSAICERKDKYGKPRASIEDFGYGKGYDAALDEWRLLLRDIERLRSSRSMHVVMLAHSWIKPFKNPSGEDFDRYELKLHAKAGGLIKEWCDAVLFAEHETLTHETNGRSKGLSTGARVVHTQRTAAWDAKNRYDLPESLPLDWASFAEAVAAHRPADPAKLKARIAELLTQADDAIKTRVDAAVGKAGDDAAQLARIADHLAATISLQK